MTLPITPEIAAAVRAQVEKEYPGATYTYTSWTSGLEDSIARLRIDVTRGDGHVSSYDGALATEDLVAMNGDILKTLWGGLVLEAMKRSHEGDDSQGAWLGRGPQPLIEG